MSGNSSGLWEAVLMWVTLHTASPFGMSLLLLLSVLDESFLYSLEFAVEGLTL